MNLSSAATLGRVNWRKLWITVVVVYVVNRGLSFLFHRVWLAETYGSLGHTWPLEMLERQWIPFVTVAVWCFFFVYLFAKGCEGKGLAREARPPADDPRERTAQIPPNGVSEFRPGTLA